MTTESRWYSKGVRRRADSARSLCSELDSRQDVIADAYARCFSPFLGPGVSPCDAAAWVRQLVMILRTLLVRLLRTEQNYQEVLRGGDEPRQRRDATVDQVRQHMHSFRHLGLWNRGPVVPEGPVPRQPDELLVVAQRVSDELASPNLELSPGLHAGVKLYSNMKTEFDAAMAKLETALADVNRQEQETVAARGERNDAMAEFDVFFGVVGRLGRALCAFPVRAPRRRNESPRSRTGAESGSNDEN